MRINIIGAGLAGSEACYQLLKRGYKVILTEMRPCKLTPAHKSGLFAELVCSNSLKSVDPFTSSGLLKYELETLDSLIIRCAKEAAVKAGAALAVDREIFSGLVETELLKFENLEIRREEAEKIGEAPVIVASGPLTSDALSQDIERKLGGGLHFFDASAPIVSAASIDLSRAFFGGRYGKGGEDYLNCPMSREEYEAFYEALISAATAPLKNFEDSAVFSGCMPIETMAKRGRDTMRFGPLRPVGLRGSEGEKYYAVVQLRRENAAGDMYNLVGFQTNLTFGEQKRVFGLIPALRNAEFLRYGVMHRNTYINSPESLDETFRLKGEDAVYFAGQITGVEGYVESAASGLLAALHLSRELSGLPKLLPPETTLLGALSRYIARKNADFQPMNANFGLLPSVSGRDKKERGRAYFERSLKDIGVYASQINGVDNPEA
ncbi:MAG: methylenetetrahydrofolate--tRNA-(uracil(54)-C(5))-methyltransferase (FADH(2)-oxidizing) TrmFO [Christensenellales bacterium]|jgi:methylenetetrahydrofolate--tRNA-(uracil-5-)-methyltransferase|nr:methylenetetrahydrofolate--tRNA-(uracil(54)-C(5))-methyltransferase (FADH(2)-oxidizing) TrmFO [Clostridia bacterium]HRU84025.1 methylenetetrahydrofolate--tRNA-(uracil(54)-C(5))-methyltransferase (FADH(2)-oxidizing) TrmFO [Eubacteriales bacterium]